MSWNPEIISNPSPAIRKKRPGEVRSVVKTSSGFFAELGITVEGTRVRRSILRRLFLASDNGGQSIQQ